MSQKQYYTHIDGGWIGYLLDRRIYTVFRNGKYVLEYECWVENSSLFSGKYRHMTDKEVKTFKLEAL